MKEPFDIFFRQTFEFINNIGGMYVVYKKMLEYFKTKKKHVCYTTVIEYINLLSQIIQCCSPIFGFRVHSLQYG